MEMESVDYSEMLMSYQSTWCFTLGDGDIQMNVDKMPIRVLIISATIHILLYSSSEPHKGIKNVNRLELLYRILEVPGSIPR
jgi:hypothetical protein